MSLDNVVSTFPTKKPKESAYEASGSRGSTSTLSFKFHVIETMSAARYPRVAPGNALLSGILLKSDFALFMSAPKLK